MNASCNFRAASERIVIEGTQTVTLDITTNYNNNNYALCTILCIRCNKTRQIYLYFHSVFGILCKMQNIADC